MKGLGEFHCAIAFSNCTGSQSLSITKTSAFLSFLWNLTVNYTNYLTVIFLVLPPHRTPKRTVLILVRTLFSIASIAKRVENSIALLLTFPTLHAWYRLHLYKFPLFCHFMGFSFPCTISVQQWRNLWNTQLKKGSVFEEINGFEVFEVCFHLGLRRKWKLGLLCCWGRLGLLGLCLFWLLWYRPLGSVGFVICFWDLLSEGSSCSLRQR